MGFLVGFTTVGTKKEGERIARKVVQKRLAACVNVLPGVISFYRWKKKLCRGREVLLVIKTSRSKAVLLERELVKIHPYELPEWVALPVACGSRRYLKWMEGNLQ